MPNFNELMDAENIPADVMLMKIENDSMMSVAAQQKRSLTEVMNDLKEELDAFPALSGEAVYCKPVGKDKKGNMKVATNLSVRAAESIASAFGFNRVTSDVQVVDENRVKIVGTFVDYQRCRTWSISRIVSKKYKTARGSVGVHSDDRFNNVVVPSDTSKVLRECILRCIPSSVKQAYLELCNERSAELLTDEKVKKIVASFATHGITLQDLEKHVIGKKLTTGWTVADRKKLAQLWAGLESNEITAHEITAGPDQIEPAVTVEKLDSDPRKAAEPPDREKQTAPRTDAKTTTVTSKKAEEPSVEPPKRKRGRPRKNPVPEPQPEPEKEKAESAPPPVPESGPPADPLQTKDGFLAMIRKQISEETNPEKLSDIWSAHVTVSEELKADEEFSDLLHERFDELNKARVRDDEQSTL